MKTYTLLATSAVALFISSFIWMPKQNDKIVSGLKDALTVGTKNAVASGSKLDGYYKNPKIKIPFPDEVKDMEKGLRKAGMNKQVDDFVVSMNRAAEGAAKDAAPIFFNAIKTMSVSDGMTLLKGGDYAATNFFRKKADAQLVQQFTPAVDKSLGSLKVVKMWSDLVNTYNKLPLVKKTNFNISTYTTRKAVDGIYILMADEEQKIRKDPSARVTQTLKDVFGDLLKKGP